MPLPLEAFFRPAGSGQRLYLHHAPAPGSACRGAVLFVHPFADEMNKARRMAALQSRALAAAGYAVLQPDLLGCGDSSGDFGDASWDDWLTDLVDAAHWLLERHAAPLWLWGLRAGALLACAAAPRLPVRPDFIFWQPAPSGELLLQQFLRLRAAAEMLAAGGSKGIVDGLRRELAAGQPVDVAGYRLNPALARGLDLASLAPPPTGAARVAWFELQPQGGGEFSPAAASVLRAWRQAGARVHAEIVTGPAFWQTTEIEDAPALIEATLRAMEEPAIFDQASAVQDAADNPHPVLS